MAKNNIYITFLFITFRLLCTDTICHAQYDTSSRFAIPIELDSVVVKSGFDPKAFIRRVQNDTTFYKAFRSMHLVPFTSVNSFIAYNKQGGIAATMHNNTRQKIDNNGCRITETKEQHATGDFFKRNGGLNYYTAELFNNLFFSDTPVCHQDDIVAGGFVKYGGGRMEKNKYELKQLIFNPGSKVSGIPFMGDRASIFDDEEAVKYDFKIKRELYEGQESYMFSITPKPAYNHKVVYNELVTWFRCSDFSILARNYSLSFSTLFYSFNVVMKVQTRQIGTKLYPVSIQYNGTWHVISKKTEQMRVDMEVTY